MYTAKEPLRMRFWMVYIDVVPIKCTFFLFQEVIANYLMLCYISPLAVPYDMIFLQELVDDIT